MDHIDIELKRQARDRRNRTLGKAAAWLAWLAVVAYTIARS